MQVDQLGTFRKFITGKSQVPGGFIGTQKWNGFIGGNGRDFVFSFIVVFIDYSFSGSMIIDTYFLLTFTILFFSFV